MRRTAWPSDQATLWPSRTSAEGSRAVPAPPGGHDLEAEAAVLGSMLIDSGCIPQVLQGAQATDFGEPYRLIFEAMAAVHAAGKPLDIVVLRSQLSAAGKLDAVGGLETLLHLVEVVPSSANVLYYLQIVTELARRRALLRALAEAVEALDAGRNPDRVVSRLRGVLDGHALPAGRSLRPVTATELLTREVPERTVILSPWLRGQGLTMICASRGVGKTLIGLGCALAIATGSRFLRWSAPEPRRVLFVDGELPLADLRARVQMAGQSAGVAALPDSLAFVTPDLADGGAPDLARPEGRQALETVIVDGGYEVIVLDNLSTLLHSGNENEAESWAPFQNWLLHLRNHLRRSVILVHHAGKTGVQRGTSKREDTLDTSIVLRHPSGYSPEHGAHFQLHYTKARGIHGPDAEPFEAWLVHDDSGASSWRTKLLDCAAYDRALPLLKAGLTQAEVAKDLGLNRSTVCRYARRAREDGDIT